MGKRLLNTDYRKVVRKSFYHQEGDLYKHYSNFIDKHIEQNPDITLELENCITDWMSWFREQCFGCDMEIDENGKIIKDIYAISVPLILDHNNTLHVNMRYFDYQLNVIQKIAKKIELKNKVFELQNQLPDPLKKIFNEMQFPDEYEVEDIEKRLNLIQVAPEMYLAQLKKEKEKLQYSSELSKPLPQLQTNLTNPQRALLFDLLVKDKFIPYENKDCFIWALGKPDEKQPDHWQPIEWIKAKWLLAYFVDVFNISILGNDGINRRTQWKPFEIIFDERQLRGSKNDYQKTGNLPEGYKQIDFIISKLK